MIDNIEQRPTQDWMCKYPDLIEANNLISKLYDGKSSGTNTQHPRVIKEEGRRLVKVPYTILKDGRI